MDYLNAFLCGGVLCAIGQFLIDRTQLTPARILTGYVVAGVLLQAVGVYQYLVDWGGAGATVPLTGFGYSLAKGVAKAVAEKGPLGILTGGLTATSGGIAAAVVFAVLAAIFSSPKKSVDKYPQGVYNATMKLYPREVFVWTAAAIRQSTAPTRSKKNSPIASTASRDRSVACGRCCKRTPTARIS